MSLELAGTAVLVALVAASLGFGLWALVAAWVPAPPGPAAVVVTSVADAEDGNDGRCTLREAIRGTNEDHASGSEPGECRAGGATHRIEFAIRGPGDYVIDGRAGHTIRVRSALPPITDAVAIDGYTQSGALPNSAPSPAPLDGILLIELDGSRAGPDANGLLIDADHVEVRGLVINSFGFDGVNVNGVGDVIAGSYIGTDPTGTQDRGNGQRGVASGDGSSEAVEIGGARPQDRALISGNEIAGVNTTAGHDHWIVRGSFIGVSSTGDEAIPNALAGGAGALSLDHSNDHVIGGLRPGQGNVITGNNCDGIAPVDAHRLVIEGNRIGVAADGSVLGNGCLGIGFGGASSGAVIIGNHFAGNQDGSMQFIQGSSAAVVRDNVG